MLFNCRVLQKNSGFEVLKHLKKMILLHCTKLELLTGIILIILLAQTLSYWRFTLHL